MFFLKQIYLLNQPGKRGMTRGEALDRLRLQEYGPNYFCGIDESLQDIIERRDIESLLLYGSAQSKEMLFQEKPYSTNSFFARRLSSTDSAFVQIEEELRPGEADEIKHSLERALSRW